MPSIDPVNLFTASQPLTDPDRSVPSSRNRHRLAIQAMLLGLLTGLTVVGFHLSLDYGEMIRGRLLALARQGGIAGPWLMWGLALTAVTLSAGMVLRFAPEAAGSGVPDLKAVLLGRRRFRWFRVLVVKFLSTVIGIVGGLVLGRGGPSIHMGGAIGQGVANLSMGKTPEERLVMVAAGGGAGLAAAFNSPLAGLMFVLEELEWRFGSLEFFTAAIACLASDMVCRAVLGQYPAFHLAVAGVPPLGLLVAFVPLGILSALLGGLFNHALISSLRFTARGCWYRLVWWATLTALVVGVGWLEPQLLGSGEKFVNGVLEGEALSLQAAALFFAIRFLLTVGSSSSGAAGGIFIPILVLGALLGWGVGGAAQWLFPELHVDTKLFAAVGMAAYFTGVVHAPLTGMVLIIEMTGNYALILPLFIACFSSLLIVDGLGNLPIYEALLENHLRKDRFRIAPRPARPV